MTTYLLLFFEFFKTGLFAFGGGLATLPFLYDISEKYGWFTKSALSDMIAISESTPGPIGINMATYAGYNTGHTVGAGFGIGDFGAVLGGIIGAVVATTALVLPSVVVIIIIAKFLQKFKSNKYVEFAFTGLRPAVCALIAAAGFQVLEQSLFRLSLWGNTQDILSLFDFKAIILFAVVFIATNIKKLKKLHPIVVLAVCAVVGIIFGF